MHHLPWIHWATRLSLRELYNKRATYLDLVQHTWQITLACLAYSSGSAHWLDKLQVIHDSWCITWHHHSVTWESIIGWILSRDLRFCCWWDSSVKDYFQAIWIPYGFTGEKKSMRKTGILTMYHIWQKTRRSPVTRQESQFLLVTGLMKMQLRNRDQSGLGPTRCLAARIEFISVLLHHYCKSSAFSSLFSAIFPLSGNRLCLSVGS